MPITTTVSFLGLDTSETDKHAKQFAEVLGDVMERGRQEGRYDKLMLIAPPHFLGALHDRLGEQTLKRVVGEVDNDLMTLSTAGLRSHLPA
ncbi:host attachment protein [Dyella sp.]|jgi:protein required for attachment to host cells|uniref:host attachment protein n=1 Tax=Dyella sp. TaxID=1869338 RepID=UPI002FD941F2